MSLCRTRNLDENDHQDNQVNNYIKMKENSDENMNNVKEKKKKISIPKDTIYKEDEDIKKKENKKEEKVEIINTDIPKDLENKKPEEKINFNMDEMDSTKEILKENEKKENKEKINNEELIQNKSSQEKKKEIQNINNDKKINEEHIENDEKKEIKEEKIENKEEIIKEDDNNKNELKENIKEENINKATEEKVELEKENNNDIMTNEEKEVLKNIPKKIENEPEIQKEEIKPESEKYKDEINNKEAEEKKEEIIEEPKEEIKKEEKPIENKEENNEEKEEAKNNEEQEQIQDENNNNEVKEEQEENKELNTKEENENEINEEKNLEIKSLEEKKDFLNNQANTDNQSFNDFLTKNDSLIKVININLESKGYSKTDIQSKIDEVFQSISESKLDQNHISSISTPLYNLLTITVDSDKKDLDKFFNELFSSLNYDKEKIHEQILTFAEDIEEQEKLKTRKLNRSIRSCIKDCQDQLNKLFKQDDMPSDRVVTYDKFNQIVEDVGIKMKKEYMDVLLYQMKMAVPKGRSIYEFNMIVIVDFLK